MAFSSCLFNYTRNKEKDTGPNSELAHISPASLGTVPAYPGLNAGADAGGRICPWGWHPSCLETCTAAEFGRQELTLRGADRWVSVFRAWAKRDETRVERSGGMVSRVEIAGTELLSVGSASISFHFSLLNLHPRFTFQCLYNLTISGKQQSRECALDWKWVSLSCLWCGCTGYTVVLNLALFSSSCTQH